MVFSYLEKILINTDYTLKNIRLFFVNLKMLKLTSKQKPILAGLFLSKFDKTGLQNLGFNSFTEAFNVIGIALNIKPASIKNYRDEFDPFFSNKRQGWHKREIRQNCKTIYDEFQNLELADFILILKEIIYKNNELDILDEQTQEEPSSFAKRLITGQAAESYFKTSYNQINVFKNYNLEDVTMTGCGFDFKLSLDNNIFLAIEVKGLAKLKGNIMLTDKEYRVAQFLQERYFLFIVRNFNESPSHIFFQNPLSYNPPLQKIEKTIKQVTWHLNI